MLSRLHSRTAAGCNLLKCIKQLQVPSTTMASKVFPFDKFPERDLKNFPRIERLERNPAVRMGFIPKSWFDCFYPKTGVSGPYMLLFGLTTYMFSKEIIVMDSEFYGGAAFVTAVIFLHNKIGQQVSDYLDKALDEEKTTLDKNQEEEENMCKEAIKNREDLLSQYAGVVEYLPDAKRENVHLQMEAAYRERLQEAHDKVKSLLDYQIEKKLVERRIAQKNLGDWVLRNVLASITEQQKKSALAQCISDLKNLSVRA